MSPAPSKVDIIQAILTNQSLTEQEKSLLVDEFINEIKNEYPDLKYHATKSDLTDLQLELTKEIADTRKEIKELDVKLTKEIADTRKEIKELDVKLTKEIADTRKEIKELDVKLTNEIKELDVKLTKEIADTRKEIADTRKDIAVSKSDTIKWVAGMLFVQVIAITGIFFAAIKLFIPIATHWLLV